MPSEVCITLGIVQATYHQPITRSQLYLTAFGQGITLLNNLLVKLSTGGKGDVLFCTLVSTMTFLAFWTLSAYKATESENSFAMPSSPKRCLKCTQSLAAQGWLHWKVAYLEKTVVGVFLPYGYYALIAEVIKVFEHPKSCHLSNGVARQAHPPIERRKTFF
jgi:hypothetical protein